MKEELSAGSGARCARALVVTNPHASRAEQIERSLAHLASHQVQVDVHSLDGNSSIANLVKEARSADSILIAGGDGTINTAIPALLSARKPVGILPLGTANDLARTLGIPFDPVEAANVILRGKTREVDVGRVNQAYFMNVASIGLSVNIAMNQDEDLKRDWGVFSYAIAAITTLTHAERFEAEITCDERTESVEAYQIAVGNGVRYGGGLVVSNQAKIDDGLLDVYAIQTNSVSNLLVLLPQLRDGTLVERDDVAFFRCKKVRIETRQSMPVNTDGEVTTQTPADLSVLRRALTFFAPEDDLA